MRQRWWGYLAVALSAVALALAVAAMVLEARIPDSFGQPARCDSSLGYHSPASGMFFWAPAIGVLAMLVAALAPRGLRWKAVVAGAVPVALVGGTLLVFSLTSESMYSWPLFQQCSY